MMLDGLESRDGAAELLAHLGVVDGGLDAVRRPAHRLGGQQRPRPGQRRFPRTRHDVVGADAHVVQADASGTTSRIEVAGHLDRHTGAVAFEQQHVVARGDQQQLGKPGAQHDSGIAAGHAVGDPHLAVQPDAGGDGSVDQAGQQPRLLFAGAVFGDHRRRDHGRDERSRRHRATEFFNHHDEFGQPKPEPPCSSSMCRPSQPSSTMSCQNAGRPSSAASSSDRAAQRAFWEVRKRAGYFGELAVIVGQCDTHDGLLAALPARRVESRRGG